MPPARRPGEPQWATTHPSRNDLAALAAQWSDPVLADRKGRLYLLCAGGAEVLPLAVTVYQAYYGSRSYDVVPTLAAALAEAYRADERAERALPVAAVLRGLDLYVVGTRRGAAYLVRQDDCRELLRPSGGVGAADLAGDWGGAALRWGQGTLYTGDALVLTEAHAGQALGVQRICRLGRQRVASAAMALGRAAARRVRARWVAVTVVRVPGITPIPDMGPFQLPEPEVQQAPRRRLLRRSSPIWPALAFAILAVILALWRRPLQFDREAIEEMLIGMLTPAATPTATPTVSLVPIEDDLADTPLEDVAGQPEPSPAPTPEP